MVAHGTCSWNHPTSGEPAEVEMVHVRTVAGGKLATFQHHTDTPVVRGLIA